jgi:hypothetical protein
MGASRKLPTLNATRCQPGGERREAPACLQPDGEGEEKPLQAGGEGELHHEPGAERRDAEESRAKQRRDARVLAALLDDPERGEGGEAAAEEEPRPCRPSQAPSLEQRVGDGHNCGRQKRGAEQVGTPGGAVARLRNQSRRGRQRDERDRHVDQEDRAPAPAEQVGVCQQPAEHEPERGGEAENRAVHPERLAALLARENSAESGQDLRDHGRCGSTLHDSRRDEGARTLGETRGEARGSEDCDPGQEHTLTPQLVAKAPSNDQGRREGKHVRGHRPLKLRAARAEIAADRRQRHVHDRDVDHVHQRRADHHHGRQPAARVVDGLDGFGIGSHERPPRATPRQRGPARRPPPPPVRAWACGAVARS